LHRGGAADVTDPATEKPDPFSEGYPMAHEIKSPIPGTFYRAPSPGEPPFKSEGDKVAKGDTIGLVEVMKTFHEVKADGEGTVASFAAENEEAVTAGQVLATLD
jgi:acetyl-CoA carboxylase biotin carboxyl carrier protein